MNKERLLKLADHLESGKLGHDEFDIRTYHSICGSRGCALGECCFLFEEWEIHEGEPGIDPEIGVLDSAKVFFGISNSLADSLFYPYGIGSQKYGIKELTACATAEDVAANIRKVVKEYEQGRLKDYE